MGRYDITRNGKDWVVLDTRNRYAVVGKYGTRWQALSWVRKAEGR